MLFFHVFEADIYPALACIPMSLRLMLDVAGIKVHLKAWNAVPLDERWGLATHPHETDADRAAFAARATETVQRASGAPPDPLPPVTRPAPWEIAGAVPPEVADRAAREGLPLAPFDWASLHTQRRFALCKLAAARHESENFAPALREFLSPAEPDRASGCVLAGGRSTRFGTDKTQLTVGGETLCARAARVLQECGLLRVMIVGNSGRRGLQTPIDPGGEDLPFDSLPLAQGKPTETSDIISIPDDIPGLGPAGGIATALLRSPGGVFAVAADMPALSVEIVRAVLDAWDGRSPAGAPWDGKRWEPLCAFYRREALPALYRAAGGRRSLQETLDGLSAQRIHLPPSLATGLVNVNTREEWGAFQSTEREEFNDSKTQ